MNRSGRSYLLAAFLALSPARLPASDGLSAFPPKVLPVLVKLDVHGKIDDVSPAVRLSPAMERLLRANLEEMLGQPSVDGDAQPAASQFVVNLALVTSPRPDGKFDVHFASVSKVPVPVGSWYWVHTDGRQLALASQGSASQRQRLMRLGDPPFSRTGRSIAPAGSGMDAPIGPRMPVPPQTPPAIGAPGAGGKR